MFRLSMYWKVIELNYLSLIRFNTWHSRVPNTAWKVSKYEVFCGPYFSVFSPNTEKYGPEKKSVFGHFSRHEIETLFVEVQVSLSILIHVKEACGRISFNFIFENIFVNVVDSCVKLRQVNMNCFLNDGFM